MENFINLLIEHNQALVAVSAILVAVLCMLWFTWNYKNLGSTSQTVTYVEAPAVKKAQKGKAQKNVDPEAAEKLAGKEKEVERLKHRIENQQLKLEKMAEVEAMLAEAKTDISGLNEKIDELESYLEDYELIEEDIANLSRYRSQSDRLLEKLREFSPDDAQRLGEEFKRQLEMDMESDREYADEYTSGGGEMNMNNNSGGSTLQVVSGPGADSDSAESTRTG